MSLKVSSSHISRPDKPRASKNSRDPSTSRATVFPFNRLSRYKNRPSLGRRLLDLLRKSMFWKPSDTGNEMVDSFGIYQDVMHISPRLSNGDLTVGVQNTQREEMPSPSASSPSILGTKPRCKARPTIGTLSIEPVRSPQGSIYDLSIYGCPTPVNNPSQHIDYKALEDFYRAPLNIYNASHNIAANKTRSAKTAPPFMVNSGSPPIYVIVRGMIRGDEGPVPGKSSMQLTRRPSYNFSSRPASIMEKKRKRFLRCHHIQTLPVIKEEDEGAENHSSASDVVSLPSPVNDDSPAAGPISAKVLECEEVKPLFVDTDIPRPRGNVARRAVVARAKDHLHARPFPLSVTYTGRRPSPLHYRPTGLRPVLLPLHVVLHDPAIHGQKPPSLGLA